GQNKHGLKKIKHALLSSQEATTLPVQAPVCVWLLFRRRRLRFLFVVSSLYQRSGPPPNRCFSGVLHK
ncbi:hypothetical protein ACOALZ_21100, partial [Nocardiopsis algeriensis]|uniref:hypothetical protein n=1 Tax=Nocardiopsis algeriensis TaxID=1478215 RepID=UPI003B427ADD